MFPDRGIYVSCLMGAIVSVGKIFHELFLEILMFEFLQDHI